MSSASSSSTDRAQSVGAFWQRASFQGVFLILITTLAYLPALRAGFVWDDSFYLTENPLIPASDGLYRLWFTAEFHDFYPLSTSTLWLEWRLWGMNAGGYHATNILLHAIGAVLLWRVLLRLNIPGAWVAGLVFALHPVNVESVAWISERKNVLSMVFYLLTLLFYLRSETEPRRAWYCLSVFMFALALLSKSAVVMLPVVVLACVWWQKRGVTRNDLARSLPFFVLSAMLGMMTVVWFQYGNFVSTETSEMGGWLSHLAGAGLAVWFYLCKVVVPVDLTIAYPLWHFDPRQFVFHVPGILLVVLLIVFWWTRKNWGRPWLFGIGCYVISLLPALPNAYPGGTVYSPVADHWQHLALPCVISLIVGMAAHLCRRRSRPGLAVMLAGTIVATGILFVLTWQHAAVFTDEGTLSRGILKHNPNSWVGHYNLAIDLAKQGRNDEAIAEYTEALRVQPADAERRLPLQSAAAHNNLAMILGSRGELDNASRHIREAIRILPEYAPAHYNLGLVSEKLGKPVEARAAYAMAVHYKPGFPEAHYNLGLLLQKQGKTSEALDCYARAVAARPDFVKAHINRGVLLASQGKLDDAIACYSEALRSNPNTAEAHNNLAVIYAGRQQLKKAAYHFGEAARLNPSSADAFFNLAMTLSNLGDVRGAASNYEEALRLRRGWPDALNGHAWLLANYGETNSIEIRKALELAEEACKRSGYSQPTFLMTLALVQAKQGQRAAALDTSQRAFNLAMSMKQEELAGQISKEIERYRSGN